MVFGSAHLRCTEQRASKREHFSYSSLSAVQPSSLFPSARRGCLWATQSHLKNWVNPYSCSLLSPTALVDSLIGIKKSRSRDQTSSRTLTSARPPPTCNVVCCNDPAKRSVLYFVMHLVACSCSGPSSIEAISTDQPETWLFCAELHFCISAYLGGAQVSPLSRRSGYIEASVGQIEDTFCFGLLFCSLIPALTHSHVFFLLQNT